MGGMELVIWLALIGSGDMLIPAVAADMDVAVVPPPLPRPDIVPS